MLFAINAKPLSAKLHSPPYFPHRPRGFCKVYAAKLVVNLECCMMPQVPWKGIYDCRFNCSFCGKSSKRKSRSAGRKAIGGTGKSAYTAVFTALRDSIYCPIP